MAEGGNGNGLTALVKSATGTPWWATAPIYLSLGIIGVPSLLAIGAGYFIASSVTEHLTELKVVNQVEITKLDSILSNQSKYWEAVRRQMGMTLEVQLRACVHAAETKEQRDDCMKGVSQVGIPEHERVK